jgi:hypothetical protein
MSAYRGSDLVELSCPRCRKRKLPALDIATCGGCNGVWVTAFAASEVLAPEELQPDPVTRWWRVREPCPACGEKMMLRGAEPGLFQGCDLHGYFIDADIVEHTRLARGIDYEALDRKRQDDRRVDQEREAREREAVRRARLRAEIEQREAELARTPIVPAYSEPEPTPPPKRTVPKPPPRELTFEERLQDEIGYKAAELLVERIRRLEARVSELEKKR